MGSICFSVRWNKVPSPDSLGNFELLLDEELAAQDEAVHGSSSSAKDKSKGGSRWK